MDKGENQAHINGKYLIIVAVIALIGTLATVYKDQLNYRKTDNPKLSNPIPKIEEVRPSEHIEQEKSKEIKEYRPISQPVKENTESQNFEGIVITIKDNDTKKPIPNVFITFIGLPFTLETDKNGNFVIPSVVVQKYGVYNTVKATFVKAGYEVEEPNIALSESHSLFLNKSR